LIERLLLGFIPDELIPATLNIGHTLSTIVQAIIYITVICGACRWSRPCSGMRCWAHS
jgi:hypothetical protein